VAKLLAITTIGKLPGYNIHKGSSSLKASIQKVPIPKS